MQHICWIMGAGTVSALLLCSALGALLTAASSWAGAGAAVDPQPASMAATIAAAHNTAMIVFLIVSSFLNCKKYIEQP